MKICILFGGKSGEHDVSLRSAASVIKNLDSDQYSITAVGIDRAGHWHLQESIQSSVIPGQGDMLAITPSKNTVWIVPSDGLHTANGKLDIDCVFPVLHGHFGEDGTVQGLLEVAGLPYVGAGVLGSAASMDKEAAKRLWRDTGLPVVDFEVVREDTHAADLAAATDRLGWPLFAKPCASGSSLGASRVDGAHALAAALAEALRFDTRVLLERHVNAREIECAVIGNAHPKAFAPGEIVTGESHGFYDYEAKYTDPKGAQLIAVADLDDQTQRRIMEMAQAAYAAVRCEGMARVDFFIERETGKLFLNEINTIPGFTSISMFPRMCQAAGLTYPQLLTTLVNSAVARSDERNKLRFEK